MAADIELFDDPARMMIYLGDFLVKDGHSNSALVLVVQSISNLESIEVPPSQTPPCFDQWFLASHSFLASEIGFLNPFSSCCRVCHLFGVCESQYYFFQKLVFFSY